MSSESDMQCLSPVGAGVGVSTDFGKRKSLSVGTMRVWSLLRRAVLRATDQSCAG
jgi:hypothetical protein